MVGETCLPNLGPIDVGSETCLLNLGPIGVRPKEGSLGTILSPLEAMLGPLGVILVPLGVILLPCWGLLVPLGLFWQRLALLKLAPRRGEKQFFISVRFAISIASNIDLGTSSTRSLAAQEAQELLKSVLGAILGRLGPILGRRATPKPTPPALFWSSFLEKTQNTQIELSPRRELNFQASWALKADPKL